MITRFPSGLLFPGFIALLHELHLGMVIPSLTSGAHRRRDKTNHAQVEAAASIANWLLVAPLQRRSSALAVASSRKWYSWPMLGRRGGIIGRDPAHGYLNIILVPASANS